MVFREGEPLPMVMKATFVHGGENRGPALFSRLGVEQFSFDATATDNSTMLHCACVNPAPGVYDFRQLDQRIMDYLSRNPQAFLLPRVYLSAPQWWLQRHPESQVHFSDKEGRLFPAQPNYGRRIPSWASPQWREYAEDSLRRMVEHIAQAPYASRIMGLFLCSGVTQEWMQWGDSSPYFGDYSPAARKASACGSRKNTGMTWPCKGPGRTRRPPWPRQNSPPAPNGNNPSPEAWTCAPPGIPLTNGAWTTPSGTGK